MKVNYPIIDGHGHILPNPDQIPKSIKERGYFDIPELNNKLHMMQAFLNPEKPWTRPVSHPTFFIKPRLEWMEQHNIACTIMITLSQLYCNTVSDNKAAVDIMKFQNDFHLGLQQTYPKQVICGFVGIPRLLDETCKEIEQRAKEGLKFLCLSSHYKRSDGMYISSTDEYCQKIFELANELHLPIQIHPYDYEEIFNLADIDTNWAGHKSPMPALTAHFYDRFISQGLYAKYPNIRFSLAHGNSVGLLTMGRQQQAWQARPDLRNSEGNVSPIESLATASNIFVDSIVHDPDLIWLLKRKIGTNNIIHGIDSPYPLGDGIDYLNDGMYPGCTLDKAEDLGYISAEEKKAIFTENVFAWLHGRDASGQIKMGF